MAKGKKKHRKGDASSEEDDEAARDPLKNTANGEKEEEEEVKKSKTQLKKEKKNKKKGMANKMQQQNQSEDDLDPLDPLAGGGGGGGRFLSEEEEEREEATMATKPKKKDKKKNNNNAMGGMASTFAMLMDEEEEAEEEAKEEAEEEEEDKKDTKAKDKKKKKKKKKGFAGAIGFDDEDEDEDNDGEDGVVVIKEKKKSKKKIVSSDAKPYICVASIVEVGRHSMAENLKVCTVDYGRKKDARVVCGAPNLMAGMKIIFAPAGTKVPATDFEVEKQPLRGVMSDGMILSATDMGWEVDEDEDMDGVIELMDVSLQVGDEASGLEDKFGTSSTTLLKEKKEEQEAKEETEEAASSPPAPTETTIQTPQDGDEDGNKTKPKDNKKNKKKKEKKKEAEEEDLDALLAELDIKPSEAPAAAGAAEGESKAAKKRRKAAERAAAAAAEAGDDANGADGDDNDGEPKELTENQKKKLKKKQKEKEKKAALEAEKAKKAAEKPKSAAVLAMQQMMEKRKIEEAAEKERLEREKREAEEAAEREAQAEREAEEKRELKKQKEKEKKERLKAEGKLLSAKQKEEQKRMEAMRAQLLAKSGGVIPQAEKKLSYKEEQALKKKRFEEAKLAAIKKKEEEEKQKEQELLAAKAAANAKAKAEESDDAADDWEAEDWDEKDVLLPAQKEEQERLKKLEEERIRKEEAKALQAKKMAATNNKEKPWAKAAREKAKAKAAAAEVSTSSDASSDSDDSDSDSDSDSYSSDYSSSYYSSSEDEEERARLDHLAELRIQRLDRFEAKKAAATADKLRCPIICILGHVDTGKTKLLDNVRRTNVQDNEAGGITQQIGATFVPKQSLIDRTHSLNNGEFELNVPGLLVIDTPGHESFTNLRSRGSSLCDLAVLVVDIMHGLEPQTIESLNMLRNRKTPFVIALNKCDRMFDWEVHTDCPMQESLKKQKKFVAKEFETRSREVLLAFAEEGLNAALYWENPDPRTFVNVIPTSAHTGEGMPDLLHTLVHLSQSRLNERIRFIDSVQCTVLEVKMIEGLGTTMDIILINGTLKEGQTIVVAGLDGPIVTTIRALLTPQPLKEIRVKANYVHHKEIQGAQGIKIVANGLEKAIAGTAMLVKEVEEDDIEELKQDASNDVNNIMDTVDRSGHGVWVQASTLGSLEALLDFLKSPAVKIPVAGVALGPVNKRDVMGASVMHERKCPQYATILAFDVPVTDEAKKMCTELDVKLMTADIIYHLFDQFSAYMKEYREKQKEEQSKFVNFPCCLRIIESCVFNKRDPIVVGVDVLKGICRVGTQITIPSQNYIDIGKIESIELNKKSVDVAKAGQSVAIKIQPGSTEEGMRMYGRHFDHTDELVARMTRPSIEALKEFYRDEMQKDDWRLVVELKTKLEKFTGEPI